MSYSKITGTGYYVPKQVVTNHDLANLMDTSDEWIQERTGIVQRRYGVKGEETTTTMALEASKMALEDANLLASDIDFIIFATLSPDYFFPGGGVLLQRELGIADKGTPALDIRTQCTGFVYGLSVADQFIKSGQYQRILLVGAEMHSMGMDMTTRGRDVSVLFGDGAGAVVIEARAEEGILNTVLHADGSQAEMLAMISPGSHGGKWDSETDYGFSDDPYASVFVTQKMLDDALLYPTMDGRKVFKNAVSRFPEVIMESLQKAGLQSTDIDMLIPHQANLRISQFVQKKMGLRDDQVFNNIQRYGNTTAASIPIALAEVCREGRVKEGDLVCMAAFGSGFTWANCLVRW